MYNYSLSTTCVVCQNALFFIAYFAAGAAWASLLETVHSACWCVRWQRLGRDAMADVDARESTDEDGVTSHPAHVAVSAANVNWGDWTSSILLTSRLPHEDVEDDGAEGGERERGCLCGHGCTTATGWVYSSPPPSPLLLAVAIRSRSPRLISRRSMCRQATTPATSSQATLAPLPDLFPGLGLATWVFNTTTISTTTTWGWQLAAHSDSRRGSSSSRVASAGPVCRAATDSGASCRTRCRWSSACS